jgi:hypothetical protein
MSALRIAVSGQSKPATHSGQLYCTEQGLGQHMGLGMLSALAKMGAAPEASSKNVTKIILTMVFFMFSPWVEWIRLSLGKA